MTTQELSPKAFELYYQFINPQLNPRVDDLIKELDQIPPWQLLYNTPRDNPVEAGLVGRLFEWFAYRHFQQQIEKDMVLLSPEETFDLYTSCYRTRRVNRLPGLGVGIANVSSPDGLLFRLSPAGTYWHLVSVLEYKLGEYKLNRTQLEHFVTHEHMRDNLGLFAVSGRWRLGQSLHQLRPEIPGLPVTLDTRYRVIYLVPEEATLNLKTLIDCLLPSRNHTEAQLKAQLAVETVPFTNLEFRQFYQHLISEVVATRPQ